MDSIKLLISRYLDGELTDEETARLAEALKLDPASLDCFILNNYIHSQLLDCMDQQRVQDRAMSAIVEDDAQGALISWSSSNGLAGSSKAPLLAPSQSVDRTQRRRRLRAWGALAASLLVVAGISGVTYKIASRPVFVGTLTDAIGCRWGTAPSGIAVGTFLQEGQELELLTGSAVVTFASGAKVMFEGPASLRLNSAKDLELITGKVAAKVPTQAIGFTVNSSLARFIDLGTAFTLHLDAEKTFELHVFEGLVEVQLDKRFGKAAQRPAWIADVHAVSFDVKSGDLETLHFQEGKLMPF
jgi:ferric-dicitrate binding protein FerR (iron transport regulator)